MLEYVYVRYTYRKEDDVELIVLSTHIIVCFFTTLTESRKFEISRIPQSIPHLGIN